MINSGICLVKIRRKKSKWNERSQSNRIHWIKSGNKKCFGSTISYVNDRFLNKTTNDCIEKSLSHTCNYKTHQRIIILEYSTAREQWQNLKRKKTTKHKRKNNFDAHFKIYTTHIARHLYFVCKRNSLKCNIFYV